MPGRRRAICRAQHLKKPIACKPSSRALERQWIRILDAFQAELLDKAELARRKERLDQERQTLTQRLQQAQRQAQQQQAKAQMLADFATFCQQIEAGLTDPTPEQQQEVFRLLIDHVVVEQDAIVIKHIIPTDDDCRLLPGRRERWNVETLSTLKRWNVGNVGTWKRGNVQTCERGNAAQVVDADGDVGHYSGLYVARNCDTVTNTVWISTIGSPVSGEGAMFPCASW